MLEDLAVDPKLVVDLNQAAAAALALQKTGTDLGAGDQGALRAAIELQNTVGATGSDSDSRLVRKLLVERRSSTVWPPTNSDASR
ncbi:MAG: hypothetical protein R2867_05275 [Caldilineaceae bacterium]